MIAENVNGILTPGTIFVCLKQLSMDIMSINYTCCVMADMDSLVNL
jgi:hypothetical protein